MLLLLFDDFRESGRSLKKILVDDVLVFESERDVWR